MNLVDSEVRIIDADPEEIMLGKLERIGRVAYKSEDRMTVDSAAPFIASIIRRGHESVLEHCSITALLVTDRATANALVRHRIAAYTQESTIYCNYGRKGEIMVRTPFFLAGKPGPQMIWKNAMKYAEGAYMALLAAGCPPSEARDVLPLATKTELIATYNIREWRHVFRVRAAPGDSWGIHLVMAETLKAFRAMYPVLFGDITWPASYVGALTKNASWEEEHEDND